MNIMLVSVNERVREIGLRMALGAKRRHIRFQFLSEALALTLGRRLIGIVLSFAIAMAVGSMPMLGALFEDDSGRGDLTLRIDATTVPDVDGVLVVTGLLAGSCLPFVRRA